MARRPAAPCYFWVLVAHVAPFFAWAAAPAQEVPEDGALLAKLQAPAEIYRAACAACHGADGRGSPTATVAFDIPLPDFTDCSFASREPAADWFAVVHAGGPIRGFDRMMPAFGLAMSPAQIEMAVTHVRSFCGDDSWPPGELNLPRPLFTEKAYPEDEFVVTTTAAVEGAGMVAAELVYEKRFGARNQIEIAVPFAFHEPEGRWSGGIGDLGIGYKRALFHRPNSLVLSLGGELVLPTGNESKGFGTGTSLIEPLMALGLILPKEMFLHVLVGAEFPFDSQRADREALWRAALGGSIVQGRFGRTWSPMLEVLGARGFESGQDVQWDVVPQFQVTLNTRQHVMANAGVRIPMTEPDSRATHIVMYIVWDWFDGGLFEGW